MEFEEIRRMRPDELEEVVRFWRRSREDAQPWLEARVAHSDADDLRHFRGVVARENEVWVAVANGAPAGLLALQPGFIDQLYVNPNARCSPTSATRGRAPSTNSAASSPSPSE